MNTLTSPLYSDVESRMELFVHHLKNGLLTIEETEKQLDLLISQAEREFTHEKSKGFSLADAWKLQDERLSFVRAMKRLKWALLLDATT